MNRTIDLRILACLLLCLLLLMTAGCTPKKDILSTEEESPAEEQMSSSYEEEEGLYDKWIQKTETEEPVIDESEIPAELTEAEAVNLVLAEVMRISGEEDPDIDQTSARVADQNDEAYLVSIVIYGQAGGDGESGTGSTELYRVDKRTGEISYLTDAGDFQ